jgi:hypothetical protein
VLLADCEDGAADPFSFGVFAFTILPFASRSDEFSLTPRHKKRSIKASEKYRQLSRDGSRERRGGADLSSCAEERRHDAQSAD